MKKVFGDYTVELTGSLVTVCEGVMTIHAKAVPAEEALQLFNDTCDKTEKYVLAKNAKK